MASEWSASNFVFSVTTTLTAGFVGYCLKRVIRWFSKSKKKEVIVRRVLLFMSVITGVIPVYYVLHWLLGATLSVVQFRVAFCAWLSQLVAGYLLLYLKLRLKRQYGDPFPVKVRKEGKPKYVVPVRRLGGDLSEDGDLELNWETIYDGIDFLLEQIKKYSREAAPDLCVAINSNGGAIASLIWGVLKPGESPKLVRTKPVFGDVRGDFYHDVQRDDFPSWPHETSWPDEVNNILLLDVEVKDGASLEKVVRFLRERYHESTGINIGVLVASTVYEDRVCDISDLTRGNKGEFNRDRKYLPDFLAFTSPRKVELPHNIR